MSGRKFTLLTGATGQIGRFLLRDFLLKQQPLAVLVRGRRGIPAEQRLAQVIAEWESKAGVSLPTPVCLEGDTTLEDFGLSQQDRQWLRDHCDTVLHNAASIDLNSRGNGDTWNNNVSSARRTLQVCRDAKIAHLAYVSTAYVCGERRDTVFEHELDRAQAFRNEYEHSKFEAERIVRGASYPDAVTVLRPAIVVGDYRSGQTHAYHSFYRTAQFTQLFASRAAKDASGHWTLNVRLTLTGEEISNFVTVDWVSAAMTEILSQPNCFGKTFHLTPKEPTTSAEIEEALQACFNYHGVQFVGDQKIDAVDCALEEQRFYEHMQDYAGYWGNDPKFDRTETDGATRDIPDPRVDVECLMRLIDYAVRNRFGKNRKRKSVKNAQRLAEASAFTV